MGQYHQQTSSSPNTSGKTSIKMGIIVAVVLLLSIGILVSILLMHGENAPDYAQHKNLAEVTNTISAESVKIGDYITFGHYEQDNDLSNGKENIEWLVLDIQDGKALVISKYGLECMPYHAALKEVTWETCSLRSWLNVGFIYEAFSSDEQAMIPTVTVSADKNPDYDTDSGNTTEDQIFLLSIEDVNKYFRTDRHRICKSTDYAVSNGVFETNDGCCWWWLRTPGCIQNRVAIVYSVGGVFGSGHDVNFDNYAVRPAMWITLED